MAVHDGDQVCLGGRFEQRNGAIRQHAERRNIRGGPVQLAPAGVFQDRAIVDRARHRQVPIGAPSSRHDIVQEFTGGPTGQRHLRQHAATR